jgi:hypothetical protein
MHRQSQLQPLLCQAGEGVERDVHVGLLTWRHGKGARPLRVRESSLGDISNFASQHSVSPSLESAHGSDVAKESYTKPRTPQTRRRQRRI